jgi:hypothetical protein
MNGQTVATRPFELAIGIFGAFNGRHRAGRHHSRQGWRSKVVLLHATANLPVSVLITPLGIDRIQPFLIFTALLIIAAVVVVGLAGPANLSRTERKQTSDDMATPPPAT